MLDPVHSSNSRSAILRLGTVQGRTTCLPNPCRTQFSVDPCVADLRIFLTPKKKSSSLHYIGKRQKSSLPEKKELWIFSNKHNHNKNGRSHSVLAASKLKVLSRERLVKTQADLNESPFPLQRLSWINFQSFSCCDQHIFLSELPVTRFFYHC